jgi:hypothetical protein
LLRVQWISSPLISNHLYNANMATIQSAMSDFETKSQAASQAAGSALTLGDELKKALNSQLADSPVIQERSNAATNFLTELSNAPTTVSAGNNNGVIFNPNQQAALIGARRASALNPLLQANQRYDLLTGTAGDIINSTTNAAKARASILQGDADTSAKMLDQLFKMEDLNLKKQKAASGGGTDLSQLLAIYRLMKPNASGQNNAINAQSALDDLNSARNILSKHGGAVPFQTRLPRFLQGSESQQLNDSFRNLADVLARLRSGAALNKDEITLYEKNVPKISDTSSTINTKLERLQSIYENVISRNNAPDVLSFLQSGGYDTSGIGGGAGDDWEVVQ